MSDVAKKAGVSSATVFRIINGQSGFTVATEQKVLNIIQEMGYKPNAVARNALAIRIGFP